MDFIEKLLGVSPDGGNGALELVYVLVIIVVLVATPRSRFLLGRVRRRLVPTGRVRRRVADSEAPRGHDLRSDS
jgi:hypothetical protein